MTAHKNFDATNFFSDIDDTLDRLKAEVRNANRWTLALNTSFIIIGAVFIYLALVEKATIGKYKKWSVFMMGSNLLFIVKNIILVVSLYKF